MIFLYLKAKFKAIIYQKLYNLTQSMSYLCKGTIKTNFLELFIF